jgi:uncharacterized membrane protein YqiK
MALQVLVYAMPILVLVVLFGIATLFQQKRTTRSPKNQR